MPKLYYFIFIEISIISTEIPVTFTAGMGEQTWVKVLHHLAAVLRYVDINNFQDR